MSDQYSATEIKKMKERQEEKEAKRAHKEVFLGVDCVYDEGDII